jgi:hypothetical protein
MELIVCLVSFLVPVVRCSCSYNYVPATSSALLQREPQLMLKSLTAEESEAYQEAQAARATEQDFINSMEMSSSSSHNPGASAAPAAAGASIGGVGASVSAAAAAAPASRAGRLS